MWKWVARGMRADLRARWPLYLSDWRDGLHIRVLAAIVFMYFTSLLPALAFANYLIDKTSGHLGVVEIILTMGMGGVLYALFCGQPLVIIGITGPISIFLDTVYSVSSSLKLPFFPFLTWIGLWTALFHIVLALSNACTLIKYATRFSGETFGVLIAIIYLVEGISDIVKYFDKNGTEGGLLSLVLAMAMFLLAMFLSNARTWNILHTVVRSYILADYAVAIAIFSITAAPFLPSFDPVSIEYLPVPHAFRPTRDRAWFVPFWRIEGWGIALAVLPALLLTTLFFFDHNISSYLSQLKRFKLRKPSAYHWDFFVLGLCAVPSALLGLPLNNGLIPQAPLHVRSVASIKEEVVDGYTQETYKRVYENRISPFAQSLLIGLTLLPGVLPLLGNIPRPVLSGLFIYMSITSLDGNEFFERVKFLMTWERRRWPRKGWAQKMPFSVTSLFTLIQLFCLGTVYGITRTPKAAMAFPVFILLLVPLRFLVLPCFFSAAHLRLLDGDEEAAADEGASSTAPTLHQLAPPGKTASEIL